MNAGGGGRHLPSGIKESNSKAIIQNINARIKSIVKKYSYILNTLGLSVKTALHGLNVNL
jgi:tRNA U38,U39,U40 pseudouridine synthase TruA